MFNKEHIYKYILPAVLVCSNLHAASSKKDSKATPKKNTTLSQGLSPRDAYLTIGGGVVFPAERTSETKHDSSSVLFTPTEVGSSLFTLPNVVWKNKYKTGYEINGILGCNVIPELRAEAEFIYQNLKHEISGTFGWREVNSITDVLFDSNSDDPIHPASNKVHLYNLLTNLMYDIKTATPLTILLGGGFGVSWVKSKSTTKNNFLVIDTLIPPLMESSPTLEKSPHLTGTAFAWQLKFGLSYAVLDYFSVGLNYRLLGTTKFRTSESSITTNPNTPDATVFSIPRGTIKGFLNNSLNLSFQFRF